MWAIRLKCACGAAFEVEDDLEPMCTDSGDYREEVRGRAEKWEEAHANCVKAWRISEYERAVRTGQHDEVTSPYYCHKHKADYQSHPTLGYACPRCVAEPGDDG